LKVALADTRLRELLDAAGLTPEGLDPWEAWRVFKVYLREPVEGGVYDAASFQSGRFDLEDGRDLVCALLVRQFSAWEAEGDQDDAEHIDAPIRRVVVEFRYSPETARLHEEIEIWTHDFPTLPEFAAVVEGTPAFQQAMSLEPIETAVYAEEL